jgi:hypothetical protein
MKYIEKVLGLLTRKKVLYFGIISLSIFFLSYYSREIGLPSSYEKFCCLDDRIFNLFTITIPVCIFSIIFFKNNGFEKWKKFTFIYLFTYLLIYLIVPTQGDGLIWLQRETVSFFGVIVYSLISILLISYKSLKK